MTATDSAGSDRAATPPEYSPRLYNADLAPATERKWGAFSIFNVWTSDVHSLYGYFLAASLFLVAGNTFKFLIGIGVGSLRFERGQEPAHHEDGGNGSARGDHRIGAGFFQQPEQGA
ncbi:hypothetical protein ACFYO0_13305 [Streptomyces sp. NPDC006365]|uniref:hypothetical protein n=1 Tax=Streptomyces sp. NPDC006365 TaxID=3364744 RepID=UPI0036CC46F0